MTDCAEGTVVGVVKSTGKLLMIDDRMADRMDVIEKASLWMY